ncbi:MAG: MerR family transcriptional regulator [Streptosporangiaceae bacterium]|jgi:MerR family redox-sensitive transcriptional activator SoxR
MANDVAAPATEGQAAEGQAAEGQAAGDPAGGSPVAGDSAAGGSAQLLTIGQLSARTGVPGSTIRFWESKGLLTPTLRRSGQRRYEPGAVRGVALLRLCQEAGLTLADIRRFRDERVTTPRSWHRLVEEKLADVQRQITVLEHARGLLSHASTCHHDDLLGCPGFQEWFAAYLESRPPAGPAPPAGPTPPSAGTPPAAHAARLI